MSKIEWLITCAAVSVFWAQLSAADDSQRRKPGPEHQRLEYFVGSWTTEGEMKPNKTGPGGKFTGSDKCAWFDGGFAVVCQSEGMRPTGPSKSIAILGYSTEEKAYTYLGIDNSGNAMTTVPRGKVLGNTWTYNDESTMGGKTVKSRAAIEEISRSTYTFTMDVQGPDGKWTTLMESKSTKIK